MTPKQIAASLSDAQRKLIPHMSDGECVCPVSFTAADAGVPDKEARKAFRELRAMGLATHGVLMNEDDGMVRGSGTWLTSEGLSVREILRSRTNGDDV